MSRQGHRQELVLLERSQRGAERGAAAPAHLGPWEVPAVPSWVIRSPCSSLTPSDASSRRWSFTSLHARICYLCPKEGSVPDGAVPIPHQDKTVSPLD